MSTIATVMTIITQTAFFIDAGSAANRSIACWSGCLRFMRAAYRAGHAVTNADEQGDRSKAGG